MGGAGHGPWSEAVPVSIAPDPLSTEAATTVTSLTADPAREKDPPSDRQADSGLSRRHSVRSARKKRAVKGGFQFDLGCCLASIPPCFTTSCTHPI